jgi:hypothetical protein
MFTEEAPDSIITRVRVITSVATCITAWLLSTTVISSLSLYASTTPLSQSSAPLYYHNLSLVSIALYFYLANLCYEIRGAGILEGEGWRTWSFLIAGGFSVWYQISAMLARWGLKKKVLSEWREGNLWRSALLWASFVVGIYAYLG